jgi:hypothetical protein
MPSPFVMPKHLRFEDDVDDEELKHLSHFKATSL